MAAYEAIRDSFREFNRTLIDSQQWDAQHESRMADQQLKETMLMNQLNQQTFNNRIKEEQLVLAKSTNKQGADRLAATIDNNKLQYEWNQTKFEKEQQTKQTQINNLKVNNQTKNTLQAARDAESKEHYDILDKGNQEKNKKAIRQNELEQQSLVPTDVVIPPNVVGNAAAYDQVKDELLSFYGASVDKNNAVIGKDGKPFQLPLHVQRTLSARTDAIVAANYNKEERVTNESGILTRDIASKKSSTSTMTSTYDQAKKAAMNRQINVMEAELENRNKYLAKLDTVKGQADYLDEWAKELRVAASKLNSKNFGDDPEGAKAYMDDADSKEAQATAMRLAERKRLIEEAKGIGSAAKGGLTENQMLNVEDLYKINTPAGVMIGDAVKPKIGTVKNVINIRYRKGGQTEADRLNYREDTVAKIDEYELSYEESMRELKELDREDVDAFLTEYNIQSENNSTQSKREALSIFVYHTFRDNVRDLAGDDSIMVYKPNKSTNKLKYLGQ